MVSRLRVTEYMRLMDTPLPIIANGSRVKYRFGIGAHDELAAVGHHVHQKVGVLLGQLLQVDAGHGLHDHVLGVRVVALDVVGDDVVVHVGADAGLVDPLVEELLAQLGLGVQNLGHEVLQVHDLDALAAKNVREGVVLLLGHREERDVVEQELLKRIGGEVQQLVAGAVKDDLLEVADFALDVYSLHVTLQSGGFEIRHHS